MTERCLHCALLDAIAAWSAQHGVPAVREWKERVLGYGLPVPPDQKILSGFAVASLMRCAGEEIRKSAADDFEAVNALSQGLVTAGAAAGLSVVVPAPQPVADDNTRH
jgi:hypothetical protein